MITLEEFKQRYEWNADLDTIGRGGYATVVRAFDKKLDRLVALKIYKTEEKGRGSLVEEFKRAMRVNHPNVLRYYDIVEVELKPGIVVEFGIMELATGGDLKKWLSRELPIEQKERIAMEILYGVKCLHDLGYVHRDLKPENVLMVGEKGNFTAKISDFGLTRVNWADKTTQSHASGTLAYMAPESIFPDRFADSNRYDKTLDIWGIGVILFQLFVGTHPFKALDPKATITDVSRLIYNAAIPPTISLAPAPFQRVIQACLKQEPVKRVREIDELLMMLDADRKKEEKPTAKEPEKPKQSIVDKIFEASKKPFSSNAPKQPSQTPQNPKLSPNIPQGVKSGPIPQAEKVVYMDCPNCKHDFPKGRDRCPHCNWIVKGPITLNYVKIGATQATAVFMVSFVLVVIIGFWENDVANESLVNAHSLASGLAMSTPNLTGQNIGWLEFILAGVAGLTVITFLGWLIRVRQNLKHFGYKRINRSLPLQVLLLFLPAINVFVLAGIMTETWQASDPKHVNTDSEDWRKGGSSAWIGFFSIFLFLNLIATVLIILFKVESIPINIAFEGFAILASISTFLLAWLFLGIIMLVINMRQRHKLVALIQHTPYGKVSASEKV